MEDDLDTDLTTTFTVTPTANGRWVRIASAWTPTGVQGLFERLFAPRMLRSVYDQRLALVNRYAHEHPEA